MKILIILIGQKEIIISTNKPIKQGRNDNVKS